MRYNNSRDDCWYIDNTFGTTMMAWKLSWKNVSPKDFHPNFFMAWNQPHTFYDYSAPLRCFSVLAEERKDAVDRKLVGITYTRV